MNSREIKGKIELLKTKQGKETKEAKTYTESYAACAKYAKEINELEVQLREVESQEKVIRLSDDSLVTVGEYSKQQQDQEDDSLVLKNLAYDLVKAGKNGNDVTGMVAARLKLNELRQTEKKYGRDSHQFSAEAIKTLIGGN